MKITTEYPIIKNGKIVNKNDPKRIHFSAIDGTSTPDDIKAFQVWYNANSPTVFVPLVVDGIFGPKTKGAYDQLGVKYESSKSGIPAPGSAIKKDIPTTENKDNKQKESSSIIPIISILAIAAIIGGILIFRKKTKK